MKKIFRYIILAILALVVAIGAGYGIISKMQQQEVALSERAMLNLEALAKGESPPGGCENPPAEDDRSRCYTTWVQAGHVLRCEADCPRWQRAVCERENCRCED